MVRGIFFNWEKFYLDYNNRDVAGNTVTLSKPSGGSFWTVGLTLTCLLYTSDAADERSSVDLGGRRIIKKKKKRDEGGRAYQLEKTDK